MNRKRSREEDDDPAPPEGTVAPRFPLTSRAHEPEWTEEDHDLMEWLEGASEQARVQALRRYLNGEDPGAPFPIADPTRSLRNAIEGFVSRADATGHAEARNLLVGMVTRLVNTTALGQMESEFAREAMLLAGSLRVYDAYPRLLALGKTESLKEIYRGGVDLHSHLLGVLFGLTNEHDVLTICRRDIYDSRYALRCFRKLWELEYSLAIPYLPELLETVRGNRVGARTALARFLKSLGPDDTFKYLPQILQTLNEQRLAEFMWIAAEIGLFLLVHRTPARPRIEMVWLLGGIDNLRGGMETPIDGRDARYSEGPFTEASNRVQQAFMRVAPRVTDRLIVVAEREPALQT